MVKNPSIAYPSIFFKYSFVKLSFVAKFKKLDLPAVINSLF